MAQTVAQNVDIKRCGDALHVPDELPALFSPGFSFILLSAGYLPDKTRDGKRDRIVLSPYV